MNAVELAQLRVFLAVARERSFRQAAKRLELSPSAVSHAVRVLEKTIGTPLLLRSTRSVSLTQAGAQLVEELDPALAQLDGMPGRAAWSGARAQGRLRLNMPRSGACLLLRPLLTGFLQAHPGVQLEITTQDGMVDIVRDGYDAGIRFREAVPLDMVAVPIGPEQRFRVVAAPALAAQHGPPVHPRDLAGLPCIPLRFPSGVRYQWQFAREGATISMPVEGVLTVDDLPLAVEAALDGLGWVYVNEFLVAGHLRAGALVTALDDWCPPEPGFQLYYPGRRQVGPALHALLAWLGHAKRGTSVRGT